MKTASQLREEASNVGGVFIDKSTAKIKEYIDSKIDEAAKKGLYSVYLYTLPLVEDMAIFDQVVNCLTAYYNNLGFSIYIDSTTCVRNTNRYYVNIEISWKETLWQKIKKIWSKK